MQIRKIIEHKYSYSHLKICRKHKERKQGVFVFIFAKSREKHQDFKNPSKIKGL
jgi:hypothetical protein